MPARSSSSSCRWFCCNRSSPISSWRSIGSWSPSASPRPSCRTLPPSSKSMTPIRTTAIPKSCRRSLPTSSISTSISCRRNRCRRLCRSRFSRCWTARSRARFRSRSRGRSGSTPSAGRTSSKSASCSTIRCCACSPVGVPPMRRTRIFSSSGWSAPRWSCSASRLPSCAIRSVRSCALRAPPKRSAKAATPISGRTGRAR